MSDIFISYAKADHALALKLSAFLEAEGWSVWWDKSLGAADLYRDEIMKQLAAARAVITIWTPNSVRSEWVRAEAGRAKAEGKLIPVKTPDVAYADIPLPFGEMHTENIGSTDLIRAAIVAQLAKPAFPVSQFWQITSTFKYNVLMWIGIVGSAITLFANLNGVLDLADWARELATHWHEWNQVIWGWVFSWIRVQIPTEVVPIISFAAFAVLLVVGVNLRGRSAPNSSTTQKVTKMALELFIGIALYSVSVPFVVAFSNNHKILIAIWVIGAPLLYLLLIVKERAWVLINSLLFMFMGSCLIIVPLNAKFDVYTIFSTKVAEAPSDCITSIDDVGIVSISEPCWEILIKRDELRWHQKVFSLSSIVFFQVLWMAVILFSPLQQLTRRLGFVVFGVLTLVGLSEISKLNLHQYLQPPKVSDNSVR